MQGEDVRNEAVPHETGYWSQAHHHSHAHTRLSDMTTVSRPFPNRRRCIDRSSAFPESCAQSADPGLSL